MSDSAARRTVSGPIWRAIQVALAALLGSAILFIGITRTQVGRSGIRAQLERAFNQQFRGTLTIGNLTGSVVDDLVATDVRVLSPAGDTVATADTIVAEPRWANLLSSELAVQSLSVVAPRLRAHRDSSGTWNLVESFRHTADRRASESPLDLTLASIAVQEGSLVTTRAGAAPSAVRDRWLFDYTRSQLADFSLRASVERTGKNALVVVEEGSFALPDPDVRVRSIEGNLIRERRGWSVNELDVSLDTTRIRGRTAYRAPRNERSLPTYSAQLKRSRLDQDELKRLSPRLPLASLVTVEGAIEGNPNRLSLTRFEVTHDASYATLQGTVARAQVGTRLNLSIPESAIQLRHVRDVWPSLRPLPDSSIGPLELTGTVEGTTETRGGSRTVDLDGRLRASSQHGTVEGSIDVRRAVGDSLRYSGALQLDSLDVAPFSRAIDLSTRLGGRVELQGVGPLDRPARGAVTLSLSPARIGPRLFSSATGTLTLAQNRLDGKVTFQQPDGGRLHVDAGVDSIDAQSTYTAVASASGFSLGPDRGPLPKTDLNARLTLRGSGYQWETLSGTAVLNVDSSFVVRGDSSTLLPPHSSTLRLSTRRSERPRIELTGSIAAVRIDGTTLGPRLWSAGRIWGQTVRRAISREMDKPLPARGTNPAQRFLPHDLFFGSESLFEQQPSGSRWDADSEPVRAEADIQVHRTDILRAWWPTLPDTTENLEASAALTISPDTLYSSGHLSAERVEFRNEEASNLTARYEFAALNRTPLVESIRSTAEIRAQTITAGGVPISGGSGSVSFDNRSGTLRLFADSVGIAGPVRFASELHVTPTTNELRIRTASIGLRGDEWENVGPASVSAYSNALVVTPLVLNRPHPHAGSSQRVRVSGTLSSSPSDTLSVQADRITLGPVSRALQLPRLIGGDLTGQLDLINDDGVRTYDGTLSVERLSYDRRILGDARADLNYSSASPDLRLKARLASRATDVDSLSGTAVVPGGPRTVEPNDLSISGRVRVADRGGSESFARTSQIPEGETLDLDADVTRADLFFFRYIFEQRVADVRGYTAGTVHIGGRYDNPIFNADLAVENGAVRLPRFGLQYELSGPIDVDERGIHLRDLAVRDDDGSATVGGSILFNDYRYFSFDLAGTLDGLTVIDVSRAEDLPFYGHIRASGPATLTGPLPDATLRSTAAETTPESELFIPVSGETIEEETGFIVFADSTGQVPDLQNVTRRGNILADRPEGQPTFVEGLNLDLNVTAPEGSTVNLVFDPIVGDVVTAVGSGRIQLQRQEGDFRVFGNFDATSGSYRFTAGEVFVRSFNISEGSITWDGDPINAQLDLAAEYRTRASPSGLPGYENYRGRIPVTVKLDIAGRVATPRVDLSLALTRQERGNLVGSETLDAILNEPALRTEYATSVLLTNTFLLTTESIMRRGGTTSSGTNNRLTAAGNQLAFNSVSQLVSSQLNRYLGAALPNVDLNFGVQGENPNDLDLIYGVALRLLNERLVIRGEGVYTGDEPDAQQARGPQGEFVVEVRLSSNVSAKVFYRRTGDELTRNQALTSSRGAGLSFRTVFATWAELFNRLFGWIFHSDGATDEESPDPVAQEPAAPDSAAAFRGGGPGR